MQWGEQRNCQHPMFPSIRNNTSTNSMQHPTNMILHGHSNAPRSHTEGMCKQVPFPVYQAGILDPQKDVMVGMFVAIERGDDNQLKDIPFFITKVIHKEQQATDDGTSSV
jgi:hypothetical protein